MSDEYKAEAWRMRGYYSGQYAKSMAALGIGIDYSDDDYDRYEAEFLADLAAHDAEVERVTAEKCARIAEAERDLHDAYLGSAVFADMRWEQGGIDAADTVARHIRSAFGLAPEGSK